jgi:hypothetical protein
VDEPGQLTVRWTQGAAPLSFTAPAEARWCARDSSLEILAVRGDSGFALALYARDTLRAESYPVGPSTNYSPTRPQAAAALRLVNPAQLVGYESIRGSVTLSEPDPVSGSFAVLLQLTAGRDSLAVSGSFRALTLLPAAPSCGRANKPGAG